MLCTTGLTKHNVTMTERKFTKEQIEQFKKELYEELLKLGETPLNAKAECSGSDRIWAHIMTYNTPRSYAELATM